MANFKTPYPVDLEALRQLLPPGAYVDPVIKWNDQARCAEVHWSSNLLKSPYQFPIEFTVAQLQAKNSLPQHVSLAFDPKVGVPAAAKITEPALAEAQTAAAVAEYWEPVTAASEEAETKPDEPAAVIVNEKLVDVRKPRGKNRTV